MTGAEERPNLVFGGRWGVPVGAVIRLMIPNVICGPSARLAIEYLVRRLSSVASDRRRISNGTRVFLVRAIAHGKPHTFQCKLALHPHRARLPLVIKR